MKVLIIGAGVGGLAAARALHADGHQVSVFERAGGLRTTGAALTLWSNGTGILADLGVSLDGVGAPVDVLRQCTYDGRHLVDIDVGRSASVLGHPNISLPRRRIIERLAAGPPSGLIEFDRACTGVVEDGDGVLVKFADGTTAEGDLLIGADGRGSAVRDHVWGADPATPSGWATWQGLSRIPIEVASSRRGMMIVGPEGMCGLMPAGEGLLQWWFDVRWSPAEPMPDAPLDVLRRRFGHWASPARDVLAMADEDDLEFFPHFRHRVPRVWGAGPITLVGDAAHSMPPTRAQGANQALEDAWLLAHDLRRGTGALPDMLPDVLRGYERTRSKKAGIVARHAGTEDINKYRPWLSRLLPEAFLSRYYTYWIKQISDYLTRR
ncbi:NAD(P)/FAD-dependent oxidoreductase [Spirillospora sp. NPDC029432]|uniref:FAD-dependent oxidoreductase n=1 Tax=Spirillospora sp. NPDC029432 TaxID=3154599 RepID=UPI0034554CE8